MIMILWRPSQNNQRYAFTPLLDESEDENDADDVLYSQSGIYDELKIRNVEKTPPVAKSESKKQSAIDVGLERWILIYSLFRMNSSGLKRIFRHQLLRLWWTTRKRRLSELWNFQKCYKFE
jgi:hypothetical protein